jgi:fructose/tagatose bisphosphate aldolase
MGTDFMYSARHGFKVLATPPLRFDILEEIEKINPMVPNCLHGSSSIPYVYVSTINKYDGALKDSIGYS